MKQGGYEAEMRKFRPGELFKDIPTCYNLKKCQEENPTVPFPVVGVRQRKPVCAYCKVMSNGRIGCLASGELLN